MLSAETAKGCSATLAAASPSLVAAEALCGTLGPVPRMCWRMPRARHSLAFLALAPSTTMAAAVWDEPNS
uniref:Uncharacterized protein n=1 Tax=Ixodes ricinus TaxID=34613 RepID=A0A6B0TTH2_IXORI